MKLSYSHILVALFTLLTSAACSADFAYPTSSDDRTVGDTYGYRIGGAQPSIHRPALLHAPIESSSQHGKRVKADGCNVSEERIRDCNLNGSSQALPTYGQGPVEKS